MASVSGLSKLGPSIAATFNVDASQEPRGLGGDVGIMGIGAVVHG